MKCIFYLFLISCCLKADAQTDTDLLRIKVKLDSIVSYETSVKLEIRASFIDMPAKYARMKYEKGGELTFESENFVLLPRRGLDFTLSELFEYPFITLLRKPIIQDGKTYKVLNVIPDSDKAKYTLATLTIDSLNQRIIGSEIHTRKEGSFRLSLFYTTPEDPLPERVEIDFEYENLKLPFDFLGRDAKIDRSQLRSGQPKTGKIILSFRNYKIRYATTGKGPP